ncbi:retropepsin family aspartate protease [Citrifermentans bemidjiense Bem]|uniref:Retropepsin family aspartate protease n=1 Tax=Citrifermentans bemidjiense (strain ATCC BAA-1014 / DSM 16622 / JCM 12645 / Bem) TaxID=404380 RepID=B5EFI4_CITBB|nr:retropepsin-like aspartic protease [Citrifermentans bemidjiense]ACH40939.1 retropepsin family aspartate protease [Citrifermentans bemidjiense Bem]
MDRLCAKMKERVALELQEAVDPLAREALLIAALYEVSRTALAELGMPRKSQEYQRARDAVLDLVSSIAIPLVRGGGEGGIAVLSELAEGCADPLLKKKLSVYAQELVAKSRTVAREKAGGARRIAAWCAAVCTVGSIACYLLEYGSPTRAGAGKPSPAAALRSPAPAEAPGKPPTPPPQRSADAPPPTEQSEPLVQKEAAAPAPAPPARGEQVTPIRVVSGQLLVPVTLKQGGVSVVVELVVDTGATRSVVHEEVLRRLPLDLRSARTSVAEVADGRLVRSWIGKVDLLTVGPFAHPSMELEVIPFSGGGEHDGLLGMDFLGKHPHQIDMERQLIRWF